MGHHIHDAGGAVRRRDVGVAQERQRAQTALALVDDPRVHRLPGFEQEFGADGTGMGVYVQCVGGPGVPGVLDGIREVEDPVNHDLHLADAIACRCQRFPVVLTFPLLGLAGVRSCRADTRRIRAGPGAETGKQGCRQQVRSYPRTRSCVRHLGGPSYARHKNPCFDALPRRVFIAISIPERQPGQTARMATVKCRFATYQGWSSASRDPVQLRPHASIPRRSQTWDRVLPQGACILNSSRSSARVAPRLRAATGRPRSATARANLKPGPDHERGAHHQERVSRLPLLAAPRGCIPPVSNRRRNRTKAGFSRPPQRAQAGTSKPEKSWASRSASPSGACPAESRLQGRIARRQFLLEGRARFCAHRS